MITSSNFINLFRCYQNQILIYLLGFQVTARDEPYHIVMFLSKKTEQTKFTLRLVVKERNC